MSEDESSSMSAAAATRRSPRTPWSPAQARSVPSTTPAAYPVRTPSAGGRKTPGSSSKHLTSPQRGSLDASSPNYFGYIADADANPPNSNTGSYARKNWQAPLRLDGSASTADFQPLERQPKFEKFRRQSEGHSFSLNQGSLSHLSLSHENRDTRSEASARNPKRIQHSEAGLSPKTPKAAQRDVNGEDVMDIDRPDESNQDPLHRDLQELHTLSGADSNLHLSQVQRNEISHVDERHPRNSLPVNRPEPTVPPIQRSETLPSKFKTDGPTFIAPQTFDEILNEHPSEDVLLIDLRVTHQYVKSRIKGAINLCIPTTLLKRASYDLPRLSATITDTREREKFDDWYNAKIIAVYDAASMQMSDAASCTSLLKKFTQENWEGATFIIRGGFNAFSMHCPQSMDSARTDQKGRSNEQGLKLDPPASAPVAGGCEMPIDDQAANPFFGTIRQNMDLIDGVGQMPVAQPSGLRDSVRATMPSWLKKAADSKDEGHTVAKRFLQIEKDEQSRMKQALSGNVSYGHPEPAGNDEVHIAGIEKGLKNRYKDILPFDHTRVRLEDVPQGGCDYINASHIEAEGFTKRYIAAQAPVPNTFTDFWRVVWEQDVRVIVMLTAENEGGNIKSHPYWVPAEYGPFKVQSLSERRVPFQRGRRGSTARSSTAPISPIKASTSRPTPSRRHSSKHSISSSKTSKAPLASEQVDAITPRVTIRKLALSHTSKPDKPLREISQIQFAEWPDFGAPAHPGHVLSLVELCNDIAESQERSATEVLQPMLVHCSAGCGRTGTFCTIDSVVDMLKSALEEQEKRKAIKAKRMAIGAPPRYGWIANTDLIFKTVASFRTQRLSMVQTLRQYVLCYESVLEWFARHEPVYDYEAAE